MMLNLIGTRSSTSKLGDPYARTSSTPKGRTTKSLPEDHAVKFGRLTDRGAVRPYQGSNPILSDGTKGGAPLPYVGQLARLGVGQIIDRSQADLNNRQRKAIADDARRLNAQAIIAKRLPTTILPGLGGLDVARSVRSVPPGAGKPGAPSGSRGILRDLKTRRETGRFAQDYTTPKGTLDALRNVRTVPPTAAAPKIAPPVPNNAPNAAPSAASLSGTISLADFSKAANQRIQTGGASGAASADVASGSNMRLLMVGALVAVVFFATR